MRKRWLKTISMLLILVMSMQLIPAQVLAAWGEAEAATLETATSGRADAPAATAVSEVTALREETVKHFRMSDGSYRAVQYGTPVHYLSGGAWQDYDNSLSYDSEQGLYISRNGEEIRAFSDGTGAPMLLAASGEYSLALELAAAERGGATLGTAAGYELEVNSTSESPFGLASASYEADTAADSSSLTYRSAEGGADIEYVLVGGSVKENIVLSEAPESGNFSFTLSVAGLEPQTQPDGSIVFVNDEDAAIFRIPAPYMYDAAGAVSYDVEYVLTPADDGYTFTVSADEDWLGDKARQYPVTVDPSLEKVATEANSAVMTSVMVRSGSPYDTGVSDILYWGYDGYEYSQHEVGFARVHQLPQIPAGGVLTAARFSYCYFDYDGGASSVKIGVKAVTSTGKSSGQSWPEYYRSLTWNTTVASDAFTVSEDFSDYIQLGTNNYGYVSWDVTALAKGWYADESTNLGVCFDLTNRSEVGTEGVHSGNARLYGYHYELYPKFIVEYRDTVGVEGYYSYQTLGAGRAGAVYVGDYTGEVTVIKSDAAVTAGAIPAGVSHVYNSAYYNSRPDSAALTGMNFGKGWGLDAIQTVTQSGSMLIYTDGDGTRHAFTRANSSSPYLDEDGLGLKLTQSSSSPPTYLLEDYSGNKMTFVNGILYEKQDVWGNKLRYVYTGTSGKPTGGGTDKLQRIDVFNSGSTSASYTAATFTYNTSGYLSKITDYSGKATTYTYDSSNRLTTVTHPDGTTATYAYTSAGKLDYLQDNESKLRLCLSWGGGGISGWVHKDMTSTTSPVLGAAVTVTRTVKEAKYTVQGRDADAPSRNVTYLFDYAGRTVYSYSSSQDGSVIYGTASGTYTDTAARSRTNNRLSGESATGRLSVNLLTGGTMETASGSMPKNWSLNSSVSGTSAARSTAQKHSGSASLSITASSAQSSAAKVKYSGTAPLTSGNKYTLSAYIRTTGATFSGTNPGAYLSVTNSNGTFTSSRISYATLTAADNGWARAYVTFTAGSSNTLELCMVGTKGTVYFDDVQLEMGDAPGSANLLEYGSAEEAGTWTLTSGSITTLPDEREGKGIKLSGGPDTDARATNTVTLNLPGSESYALSAWANASAVPHTDSDGEAKIFRLKAVITYSDNTTETHTADYCPDVTAWQYITLLILPKQQSKTVKSITCYCEYLKNNGSAYFDDVSLTRQVAQCYEYDANGNLTSLENNKTNDVTATYNGNDLTRYIDRSGVTYDYSYGSYHNVTSVTDGTLTANYTYDKYGNVTRTTLTGSNTPTETAPFLVTVTASSTKVYNLPGSGATSTTKSMGTVLTINAVQLKSGAPWGRLTGGGWVALDDTNYENGYTVATVGAEGAAVRYGPGLYYDVCEVFYQGKKVVITETQMDGSDQWGKVEGSYWIVTYATDYASVVGTTGGNSDQIETHDDAPKLSSSTAYTSSGIILPSSSTDAMGETTSYTYGNSTAKQYGTPTAVTAPDGTQSTTTYNANNGRTTSAAVGDASVDYTYTNGRLTEIERTADRNGTDVTQSYTIGYGAFGDQTSVSVGSSTLATYTHNARTGDIEYMEYGNGAKVWYRYDDLDRLYEVSYNDEDNVRYRYRYTGEGQLFSVEDLALGVTYTYTYDSLGRLIYSGALTQSGTKLYTSSAYDAAGRLSATSYAGTNISGSMSYVYDEDTGLLESVTLVTGGKQTILYDGIERPVRETFTTSSGSELYTRVYGYTEISGDSNRNTAGLVKTYDVGYGTTSFASYTYTYDKMGRITSDGTYTYVYDELGQLIRVKDKNDATVESYTYDAAGNILSATKNNKSYTYTYNSDRGWRDQLTKYDGTTISYDAIGNPLSYRGWTFTWQDGRRLATASKGSNSISYTYDVDGIRYTKTVNGTTHSYIYAGGPLLQEKYGNTVMNFLYDANGRPYAIQYSTNSGSSYTTYYYITNLQGDVVGIIDSSRNRVVTYTYDSWGMLISTTGSMASSLGTANPLRYRGYYYDTETALYYLQSRYYDPQVGRFINADDAGLLGANGDIASINLFAYCGNNPVDRRDVSGEFWDFVISGVLGAATNVVTTYIAAKATGQDYTLMDLGKNAAIGFANAIPYVGPIIAGVASGYHAWLASYQNGTSMQAAIICGIVSGVCTTLSISNLGGWPGTEMGKAMSYGVATATDVVFGTGYNCIAAGTSRGFNDAAQGNPRDSSQETRKPYFSTPGNDDINFILYCEGLIWSR